MARRPDGSGRFTLTPRSRRIAGWVAALAIVGGIALFVRFLGGDADGTAVVPSPSSSPAPGETAAIRFGTRLDPATGEVAADAETDRFVASDRFAYSFRPAVPPPETVWVEVRRGADGAGKAVQEPSPQSLAAGAPVIGFEVDASALFEDFGSGPFEMRIYLAPDGDAVASGSFELVATVPSASPSGGS
jgi:hypothetical protein